MNTLCCVCLSVRWYVRSSQS